MGLGNEIKNLYLGNIPAIHTWDGGKNWNSGGFNPTHLEFFISLAEKTRDCRVIETGAGNSTIAFLIADVAEIVSIAPDGTLFNRIRDYCEYNNIPAKNLEAIEAKSEWALPGIAISDRRFDIGLIDGAHGWPNTFVDLNYIYFMLRKDGFLIIDDVQLHSIKEMAKFITAENESFRLVKDLGKVLVFQKLTENRELGEWNHQKYIVKMTSIYEKQDNPFALDSSETTSQDSNNHLLVFLRKVSRKINNLFQRFTN
jgi:hypothetical protein